MHYTNPQRVNAAVESLRRYVRMVPQQQSTWVEIEHIRLLLNDYDRLKAREDARHAAMIEAPTRLIPVPVPWPMPPYDAHRDTTIDDWEGGA